MKAGLGTILPLAFVLALILAVRGLEGSVLEPTAIHPSPVAACDTQYPA
jgi:hypothetical protein